MLAAFANLLERGHLTPALERLKKNKYEDDGKNETQRSHAGLGTSFCLATCLLKCEPAYKPTSMLTLAGNATSIC